MPSNVPIAIFTYNRSEHTRNMLASLAACARLDECDVFIYSDAPRISEHVQKVEEVRALVRAWGAEHGAKIIERENNLGLTRSIVGGVTELCGQYGRVIVIEDDLVLHPAFLNYMLSALDRYENEERVAQVVGYMHPIAHKPYPNAFFLPFTSSWGWATWNRSWELFDWKATSAEKVLSSPRLRYKFDLNFSYPFAEMLEDRLAGKNQSWGILFYLSVFQNEKQVLHPAQSLVKNIGFDGSGYHYNQKLPRLDELIKNSPLSTWRKDHSFIFPDEIATDMHAFTLVKKYLYASTTKDITWIGRAKWIARFLLGVIDPFLLRNRICKNRKPGND